MNPSPSSSVQCNPGPMNQVESCTLPDTNTILQQLWNLVSKSESMHQLDRQIILIEAFLSKTGENVDIADLDLLSRILMFLAEKELCDESYHKYLSIILNVLKHPPIMKKASDELNYKQDLVQFFSTLGCIMLQTEDEKNKFVILELVQNVIKTRSTSSNLVPIKACIHAIELSELMDCMADFIAIAGENIYYCTVYTTLQISQISKFSCWALLVKNLIDTLLVRLSTLPDSCRKNANCPSYQLLWTLFSCTNDFKDWSKVPPPSKAALRSLKYSLRESIINQSYIGSGCEDFNNIAAVVLKLMHLFPTAEYITSGLLQDIACFVSLYGSCTEFSIKAKFKNKQTHFQFQKLMMSCLSLSPISLTSLEIFEKYQIAQCLVIMMSMENHCNSTEFWSLEQIIELFRCSLQVTNVLFDPLQEQFIEAGIAPKLLSFLDVCYINAEQPMEDLAHSVIETLSSLCYRKNNAETTSQSLREEGAIEVMLKVCKFCLKPGSSLTIRSQSIIFNSLLVLANLMDKRQELEKEHVETAYFVVTTLYKRILNPDHTDSLIDNRLTVAVANFAWKFLFYNQDTILRFISSGGVFLHIDILERSSFSEQLVFLSVLSDICEYHQSIPFLLAWQSQRVVSILSVLCRIWRAEEKTIGVPRSKDGCILDIERPLMGNEQYALINAEQNNIVSICDVYGSARPKIYAVVQLVHRHKEVIENFDDKYRLLYDKLPLEDKITMKVVEAYLPLKLGEIWWEIKSKQKTVMPIDRYLAETLTDRYLEWAQNVQRAQQQLVAGAQQEDLYVLGMGRGARLTSALEAVQEVVAIANSLDRQLRLLNWRRLKNSILASRPSWAPKDLRPHIHNSILMGNGCADVVLQHEVDGGFEEK